MACSLSLSCATRRQRFWTMLACCLIWQRVEMKHKPTAREKNKNSMESLGMYTSSMSFLVCLIVCTARRCGASTWSKLATLPPSCFLLPNCTECQARIAFLKLHAPKRPTYFTPGPSLHSGKLCTAYRALSVLTLIQLFDHNQSADNQS